MKVVAPAVSNEWGNPEDAIYSAYKCNPQPRFRRGAWDTWGSAFNLEAKNVGNVKVDGTKGHWGYFKYEGVWYSFDLDKYQYADEIGHKVNPWCDMCSWCKFWNQAIGCVHPNPKKWKQAKFDRYECDTYKQKEVA